MRNSWAYALLIDDGIAQDTQLRNFNFNDVPWLQPGWRLFGEADATRCARRNNITGQQLRECRTVGDQGWYIEDQVADFSGLHDGAIEARLET